MKRIPCIIKAGRNYNKKAGEIVYPERGLPYYFCIKTPKQMMVNPVYRNLILLSESIIKDYLVPKNIKIGIWELSGFEKETFFIVIPIEDFIKGKTFEWDDRQKSAEWGRRERYYEFPKIVSLMEYIKDENM